MRGCGGLLKIEYVCRHPIYGLGWGVGRMLDASVGTSFVADVICDRESPGDFGNRGSLLPPPTVV